VRRWRCHGRSRAQRRSNGSALRGPRAGVGARRLLRTLRVAPALRARRAAAQRAAAAGGERRRPGASGGARARRCSSWTASTCCSAWARATMRCCAAPPTSARRRARPRRGAPPGPPPCVEGTERRAGPAERGPWDGRPGGSGSRTVSLAGCLPGCCCPPALCSAPPRHACAGTPAARSPGPDRPPAARAASRASRQGRRRGLRARRPVPRAPAPLGNCSGWVGNTNPAAPRAHAQAYFLVVYARGAGRVVDLHDNRSAGLAALYLRWPALFHAGCGQAPWHAFATPLPAAAAARGAAELHAQPPRPQAQARSGCRSS